MAGARWYWPLEVNRCVPLARYCVASQSLSGDLIREIVTTQPGDVVGHQSPVVCARCYQPPSLVQSEHRLAEFPRGTADWMCHLVIIVWAWVRITLSIAGLWPCRPGQHALPSVACPESLAGQTVWLMCAGRALDVHPACRISESRHLCIVIAHAVYCLLSMCWHKQ